MRRPRSEKDRRDKLKRRYGITVAQYEDLFVKQHGLCAICAQPCQTGRRLAVDHDHATEKVRGLLCTSCNNGLGRFKDSPELLRRAAQYLNRKYQRTSK